MDLTVSTIPISRRYLRLLQNDGFFCRQKDYFWTGMAVATFPASASSDLQRDVTVFVSVKKLIPFKKEGLYYLKDAICFLNNGNYPFENMT